MEKSHRAPLILWVMGPLILCLNLSVRPSMARQKIPIGLMLDLNSGLGSMANNCIALALQDFYSRHPNYETRIDLKFKDSPNDVVIASDAALDLIQNEKVHAILGPQNPEQARYVVKQGEDAQVPVIWFPITGPALWPPPPPSQYPIDPNQPPCFQFKAIPAIVEAFGWQSIIPIYEQTEYGSYLMRCLGSDVSNELNTRLVYERAIHPNSTEAKINKTLDELNNMTTHVFLVHMTVDLGSTFIKLAQKKDMMGEGYAWILTQGLSSLIDPGVNNITLKGYMQGALGVRPKASKRTRETKVIEDAFKGNFSGTPTPTLYGWWAYDTIQALAFALESGKAGIGMYDYGPKLRNATLQATDHKDFQGVSGTFSLMQRQVEPSEVEVFNVIGQRERIIGYWSPRTGLAQNFSRSGGKYKLKEPMWPGDTMEKPPKLRIGIPGEHLTRPQTSSFAINVFSKALDLLPFPLDYDFVPFTSMSNETKLTAETYDDLLCQINQRNLDAIIGDITIVANRSRCVDFTLPYLDTSVSMVVKVRREAPTSKRILLEPFHWSLWFLLGGIFGGATIIAIISENNKPSEKGNGDNNNAGIKNELIFNPFLIYKIEKLDLKSTTARWTVILTSFLFVIVSQVYLANLTSILSERKTPKPSLEDLGEISRKNLTVGYQRDSWVKGLLIKQLRFDNSRLKAYGSREEYNDALSNGSVVAIVDETPYLALFLSKYNSDSMMAGPIYKAGGFAFAFPKNSRLVSYFSNAILNVTQDVETFRVLRTKSSLPTTIDELEYSEYESELETHSLGIADIGGLYPIVLYVLALLVGLVILNFSSQVKEWPCWPKTNQGSNGSQRN